MILGVPKEVKIFENRVGMTPEGVKAFVELGHQAFVERGAGMGSGFSDQEYQKAGANILPSAEEVYAKADIIVKVKEPQAGEFGFLRPGLVLFTFLHLAAEPALLRELLKRKVTAIAYETVETDDHRLPLLSPMSEIAGSLAGLIGANYLRKDCGGKGILLNAIGSGTAGRVLIMGAGHVGLSALKIVHGLGAEVLICDINRAKLDILKKVYPQRLTTYRSVDELKSSLSTIDLLIGAVLIPGKKAPHLIKSEMVKGMEAGSVIIDVAVDQGGCVETIHPTNLENPTYEKFGVIHYGVTNMPSLVPRSATKALVQQTLPHLLEMASLGVDKAMARDPALKKGLNVRGGDIVHPALKK